MINQDIEDLRHSVGKALAIVTQDLADRMLIANRKYIEELVEVGQVQDANVEAEVQMIIT